MLILSHYGKTTSNRRRRRDIPCAEPVAEGYTPRFPDMLNRAPENALRKFLVRQTERAKEIFTNTRERINESPRLQALRRVATKIRATKLQEEFAALRQSKLYDKIDEYAVTVV